MTELPQSLVGAAHRVRYHVRAEHMVGDILPGVAVFAAKPQVMATGWLVAVCEWPPMEVLARHLDRSWCSLGTRVEITHLAPVAIGATLQVATRCLWVRGRRSRWTVEATDDHELVGTGHLEFAVVHTEAFVRRRLDPKCGPRRRPERAAPGTAAPPTVSVPICS